MEVTPKSGEKLPVLNSIETITIGDKQYFLSAIIDIAERKKAEQEIQRANTELKRMNEELASFAYVSSHDLQEPLRKIQAFSKKILLDQEKDFTSKTKDNFNRIINASERMQNLIDALLNYSRINTSENIFVEIDLNTIVEEVKSDLQESIEKKNARITSSDLPVLPVIRHQFNQLLSNIISNSIKYSKEDVAPVITIKAEKVSAQEIKHLPETNQKQYWKISIEDNGIGFEQEYEHKIFELFQRLHSKGEYSGTGIGLAICKKVIQNHKGVITATSEPGKGATFNIYLPTTNA